MKFLFSNILLILIGFILCVFSKIDAQNLQNINNPIEKSTYKKIVFQFDYFSPESQINDFSKIFLTSPYNKGFKFQIQNSNISLIGKHLTVSQYYDNIPIYNAVIKINMNMEGKAFSFLNGSFLGEIPSFSTFMIDTLRLKQIVLNKTRGRITSIKKIWLPIEKSTLLPCYNVTTINDKIYGGTDNIYHAGTGELIKRESLTSSKISSSGKGRIFNPDPLTSGKKEYNCDTLYCDKNDSNNDFFDTQYQNVTLNDIQYQDSTYLLKGPYALNQNIEYPEYPPVVSKTGDFIFNRSEAGFEQVNVYYHIDKFQRYVQTFGFKNLCNHALRYDAHGDPTDNSKFISEGVNSYLLFGVGGVDDAEDADVIIHEYSHALSAWGSPNSMDGFERKALDEGICDYFAASESRNFSEYRWSEIYTWDGHNEFWKGRNADTKDKYPDLQKRQPTIHIFGQIWSSALMSTWNKIGKSNLDKIMLQELYMNNVRMNIKDAAYNVLDIDSILFNSIHHKEFANVFCDFAIFNEEECKKLTVNDTNYNQKLSLKINGKSVFYEKLKNEDKRYSLKIFDMSGKVVYQDIFSIDKVILEKEITLESITNGIYVICIFTNENTPICRKMYLIN